MASAVGRQRGIRKQLSSEDQALNMIAKEAEARLSAKRAARAEARSIRMKELERKQKEIDDLENDELDTSRRKSSSRLASPSSSSPLGSDLNLSADSAMLKETLKETEDKYKKAMVNAAQLDNERQALLYQVEVLKDIIEDLEENICNVKDELQDKTKEFNKLSRDHEKTSDKLEKTTYNLSERERILDEHGINLDGSLKETEETDGNDEVARHDTSYMSNHHLDSTEDNEEKQTLLSEIENLRNEIAELKSQQETTGSRKTAEHARTGEQRADFERSFVDVSSEAAAIQDDDTHTGMYVNNNEKCDDFEVIDDGSQQGGIRNFEDKSFEQSGRSSLLSSVQTDLVSDSIESEVPLEISVDVDKNQNAKQQDDYDIVQIDDESKRQAGAPGTTLDIGSLSGGKRAASPLPESNININKYLFSDNDDDDDEHEEAETSGTFNINMYFATEEKTNSSEFLDDDTKNETNDDVDTSPEELGDKDLQEGSVTEEVASETSSPFLEVKSQANNSEVGSDDNKKTDVTLSSEIDDNKAEPSNKKDESSGDEMNNAFVANDEITTSLPVDKVDAVDSVSEKEESEVVANNNPPPAVKKDSLTLINTESDLRKSVEDLYERILSEDSSEATNDALSDTAEGLPDDATFGEPIGLTATVGDDDKALKSPVDGVKKKEGWLVRVESFSTPSSRTPQIKVIGDAENENNADAEAKIPGTAETPVKDTVAEAVVDNEGSPAPVPKERKKKKKKNKKQKSVDILEASGDAPELNNSPPESRERPDSATTSPVVSPTKHKDIPKQFLDASNSLAAESYSDTSDVEQEVLEDGTTVSKKRQGSKKKSKESCKTQ